MAVHLSCFDVGYVAGKKCYDFLGQGENFRGSLGDNLFLSLILGFLHHNF